MGRTEFRWLGKTKLKNMVKIRELLELNHISPEFQDAGMDEVRFGVPRFASRASYVLRNHGWKNIDGNFKETDDLKCQR